MRKIFVVAATLCIVFLNSMAQSYKKLADSALHLMWDAKDDIGLRNSLSLYEKAFTLYPNDVQPLGYYKAAVLAGNLNENETAFRYLEKLLALNTPIQTTWSSIVGPYAKSEYKNLLDDQRWLPLAAKAKQMQNVFLKDLEANQSEFATKDLSRIDFSKIKTGEAAYQVIRSFNQFKPKSRRNYSIKFKVKDSVNTSYFVSLPAAYNPKKSYPVLFFLHGAVSGNSLSEYQNETVLGDWNRYYTKYAQKENVIMVYPKASKKYNWMVPDDGFFMIPAMLKEIKLSINVDDNKVFITGHSNGATGSFSYLMKAQSPFAGFYGFNTQPKVRTGGTFLRNILNRSYFNVSTDEDYYFPPDANDTLNSIMKGLNADYQDHRFNGWPHWFPQFDESEAVYPLLFGDLKKRERNAFQHQIYWECDDVTYGKTDWIQITELDTNSKPSLWHQNINFNIYKLLSYDKNNDLVTKDTLVKAFNFPRKSAAIKASYSANRFEIETSEIKSLRILISPEMIDVNKPVFVYINGVKKLERKAIYNKDVILKNFLETADRKAIWIDQFDIDVD